MARALMPSPGASGQTVRENSQGEIYSLAKKTFFS